MLVHDLDYMEVASSNEVEGGFAFAYASAFSTAFGNNTSSTQDTTNSATSQQLVPFGPGFIANFTAGSAASSSSMSA